MARSPDWSSVTTFASAATVAVSSARARRGAASTASAHRANGPGSAGRRISMIRRACTGPMPSCSRSTRNQATSSAGLATTRAADRKSLT